MRIDTTCPFIPAIVRTLALPCALAAPLGAQMLWTGFGPGGPAPRGGHAMAYDAARQNVVVFSGGDPMNLFGDTWTRDGTAWTLAAQTGPSARVGHAMVYDDARRRIVMFGGIAGTGSLSDETWEWDGSRWMQRFPANRPPARWAHAMAYDAVHRRVVLFGGEASGIVGDTWEWDGTTWTRIATAGPRARAHHAMASDRTRARVVLFGGFDANITMLADTWEWDGASWVRSAATGPRGRSSHAMAFDSARERVVLFGGRYGWTVFQDTWEWDGTRWTRLAPVGHPSARLDHAMAYDASRRRLVLHGGHDQSNPYPGDTWEYHPTVRGSTTPIGTGCAGSAGIPTATALGPPIVGNGDFALVVSSVPAQATAFVGISAFLCDPARGCNQTFGPCTVYPLLPFPVVVRATATASGTARLLLPIPWDTSLSGASVYAQGGAINPHGLMLGLLSLTAGQHIVIGD